jgi:hypothetical protein
MSTSIPSPFREGRLLELKIVTFVRLRSVNGVQERTKPRNGIERLSCFFLHFVVWVSPSAGRNCAHNPRVVNSNLTPATILEVESERVLALQPEPFFTVKNRDVRKIVGTTCPVDFLLVEHCCTSSSSTMSYRRKPDAVLCPEIRTAPVPTENLYTSRTSF